MSNEPNLDLMREIGLIPSGKVPKYPVELFIDYPDLIDGVHEYAQKLTTEYKQRAEAAEDKLRELEMQKPVAYLKPSGETRVAIPCPIGWFSKEIPLYAQPFPFHKQEVEMEIIAYLEAEPNARNEHPRDVIGSMVYSMRITKEKPKSKRNVIHEP